MKIERQKAMVKSIAKNMRQKEKQEAPKEKIYNKLYAICNKYDCALDEINGSTLLQSEYNSLLDYFKIIRGISTTTMLIALYPNMKR